MPTLDEKRTGLQTTLRECGSILVAFSGGVDSTLLLFMAKQALGDRVLAVTAASPVYPRGEIESATATAQQLGARHLVIETHELEDETFVTNPVDRCYHCKLELFGRLREIADQEGLALIVHGATQDDLSDHRPGFRAARELGVRAPLIEVGLTKDEVRALSKEAGLPTWDRPSMACLASRFPYGESLTPQRLGQVEQSELALRGLGFRQARVRYHGPLARVEVLPADVARAAQPEVAAQIMAALKVAGFVYVTLDLQGFRSGSMNEVLPHAARH